MTGRRELHGRRFARARIVERLLRVQTVKRHDRYRAQQG